MTKNKDPNKESLVDIAVDPDVLARELALEIEIDPLEQIDEDAFSKNLNISQECDEALKLLNSLACSNLSFTPLSIRYSKLTLRPVSLTNFLQSSIIFFIS